MSSQGPNFPTAATGNTNANGLGSVVWTNPANIEAADSVFATASIGNSGISDDLIGTGFGFSIPAGATINGILLEVNYKASANSRLIEDVVFLIKGGSAVGSNLSTGAFLTTTATTVSYGGSSNLWGTTWTPADINASNFGAVTVYSNNSTIGAIASVDFFRITVFYTVTPQTGAITLSVTSGESDTGLESTAPMNDTLTVATGFTPSGGASDIGGQGMAVTSGISAAATFNSVNSGVSIALFFNFVAAQFRTIVVPIPSPPVLPPAFTPSSYLSLVTSEHNQRPNFMAMMAVLVQPFVDLRNLYRTFFALFDLDFAVGDQLDKLGQWIGVSRNIPIPLTGVYFSWGTLGLGWGQGSWFGPGSSLNGLTVLADQNYRTLLRATIAKNLWDGTVPGIYNIWAIVFQLENFQILIQDNQDMSMTVLLLTSLAIDAVSLALVTNGFIIPRPAGVRITGYQQITAPIFGWGLENNIVQGWGQGNWV